MKAQLSESRDRTSDNTGHHPDVIVDFVFDDGLLFVTLQNIGDEPAVNVTTTFNKTFTGVGGEQEISTLAMFRKVAYLAPHREITTFVDTSASYFKRKQPNILTAAVVWRDRAGKRYSSTMRHDLSIYKDIISIVNPKPARHVERTEE